MKDYRIARGIPEHPKKQNLGSLTSISLSSRASRPMLQSNKSNLKTHKQITRSFSHSSSRFSEITPPSNKRVVTVDINHPLAPYLGAFWDFILQIQDFLWPGNARVNLDETLAMSVENTIIGSRLPSSY